MKSFFFKCLMVFAVVVLFLQNACLSPPPVLSHKEQVIDDLYYLLENDHKDALMALENDSLVNVYVDSLWQSWDPIPTTTKNELKREYYQRLEYVNKHYPSKRGWPRSDRGRVYLLYGPPDDIIYHKWTSVTVAATKEYKAFEIWVYNRTAGPIAEPDFLSNLFPGAMKFVFADVEGFRHFEQIYSTESGEKISSYIYRL